MPLSAAELAAKFAAKKQASVPINRDEIIAANPILEFLACRGVTLRQSGESFITNVCPVGEHRKLGHRPVSIDPVKQVWYCNDHKTGGSVIDWEAHEKKVDIGTAIQSLNGKTNGERQFVCAYDYTDENGTVLFQSVRYKVPPPKKKTFLQRQPSSNGNWIWGTKGVRRVLYHLPQILAADTVVIVEGEKDAEALTQLGFVATTNVGGAGKWRDEYADPLKGKNVVVFGDIGDPDRNGENHTEAVLRSLTGKVHSLKHAIQPQGFHDVSDWIATLRQASHGEERQAIQSLIDQTKEFSVELADEPTVRRARLTIRTIDEILSMKFDSRDLILKNGYLTKGDLTALCGMGGVGKSRLAMQFTMCCRAGQDFIGWQTNGRELNFLFLQTENSCRRLQSDLEKMLCGFTPEEQAHIKAGIFFHTLEGDDDGFLMLDPENLGRVSSAINHTKADVIVFDPLRDFSLDDLNSDKFMGETLRSILRVTKRGNPKRAPLAIHHATTGKAGAQKASGWDRSSFGRNSKVLQIIARAQINVAPAKGEDNSTIIVGSGKCNNAQEFKPFAARLNFQTMLYSVDETVDMERWHEEVSESKTSHIDPKILREVLARDTQYERTELVEILKDEPVEVQKSRAYDIIRQATARKILKFNKITKTYELT